MIYNQIVTWTAFTFLAMFLEPNYFQPPCQGSLCPPARKPSPQSKHCNGGACTQIVENLKISLTDRLSKVGAKDANAKNTDTTSLLQKT